MLYSKLVEVYEELEKTSARLGKIDAIARILKETETESLPKVVLLLQGKVFPNWSEFETGIADKMIVKIVSTATGFSDKEVMKHFNETGDLGLTVEKLLTGKKQQTLGFKQIDITKVFENLQKLATVEGKGSQEVKINIVKELVMHSNPKEAKYIVRTALGQLRVGVAEGVVRDAIAAAFFPDKEGDEKRAVIRAIEWAWFMRPDYGEVACIAKQKGLEGLKKAGLELGKPFQVLLAEKSPSLKEALESYENAQIEVKFDGARIQAHKDDEKVWLFTRRLENVTRQFPDIVKMIKGGVKAGRCVLEGEAMALGSGGKPAPFQLLSQRIHRKYDIDKMVKEIPIQMNWFDIVFLEGNPLFDKAFKERRKMLESVIKVSPGKFQLAEPLLSKDLQKAEKFYQDALYAGQEGVMVKNLDATYQPGRRVAGGWLKVKPIMETLDLVITGAQWGTGKRAGWMGSFVLACRDQESGEFLECGMMGTGVKEKKTNERDITFRELTEMLKPSVVGEKGNMVRIKPMIVIEIAYEEIQKSPNYDSGYALRFPRLVSIRPDKSPEECDDIERMSKLYAQQKGRK
ncbi:MAG: ATP-dependent DNA ligase [Candidatus Aenigmatarchaeota archaeon]|nr:MAG: ATP-dependent DNA ligase [Candidatus Aenigmarchaeota archaeon]